MPTYRKLIHESSPLGFFFSITKLLEKKTGETYLGRKHVFWFRRPSDSKDEAEASNITFKCFLKEAWKETCLCNALCHINSLWLYCPINNVSGNGVARVLPSPCRGTVYMLVEY